MRNSGCEIIGLGFFFCFCCCYCCYYGCYDCYLHSPRWFRSLHCFFFGQIGRPLAMQRKQITLGHRTDESNRLTCTYCSRTYGVFGVCAVTRVALWNVDDIAKHKPPAAFASERPRYTCICVPIKMNHNHPEHVITNTNWLGMRLLLPLSTAV